MKTGVCDHCLATEKPVRDYDEGTYCLDCIIAAVEAERDARFTPEQLLSDPALQALYEHFGIPSPEIPAPAPPVKRRLREGMEAALAAVGAGR